MDRHESSPVLVEFLRDDESHVETRHRGAIAVVASSGQLLWQVGDPAQAYALRSSIKPFQLLPLLIDGLHEPAGDRAPLSQADLAVMMSSHNGEPMHTERIAAILSRLDIDQSALRCGIHPPLDESTRNELLRAGNEPSALHCNCSGKHTQMLAVCAAHGWPMESYLSPEHPLHERIHALLVTLIGEPESNLTHSLDGCSLPTYWLPLARLAQLFAYLADPAAAPPVEGRKVDGELKLLREAGMRHPEMVAGSGRLDTRLMRTAPGRVFAKSGAAGMYAAALPAGPGVPEALGIAIKVDDGDPQSRIRAVAIVEVLKQLGVVTPADSDLWPGLEEVATRKAHNFRDLPVGEYRAVFELRKPD